MQGRQPGEGDKQRARPHTCGSQLQEAESNAGSYFFSFLMLVITVEVVCKVR